MKGKKNQRENDPFSLPMDFTYASSVNVASDDSSVTIREITSNGIEDKKYSSLKDLQSSKDFASIMEAARNGRIFSIEYTAVAFVDKPNNHFTRPKPGSLKRVSERSRAPAPMQIDHNRSVNSTIGQVTNWSHNANGKLETVEAKNSIREPDYQVRFLRGELSEYSVGLGSIKGATCSICNKKYKSRYGSSFPNCDHTPGTKYDGVVCEAYFSGARFIELSATPFGAVEGARAKTKSFSLEMVEDQEEIDEMTLEEALKKIAELNAAFASLQATANIAEASLKAEKEAHEKTKLAAKSIYESARDMSLESLVREGRITPAAAKDQATLDVYAAFGVQRAHGMFSKMRLDPSLGASDIGAAGSPEPAAKPNAEGQYSAIDTMLLLGIFSEDPTKKQITK